MYRLQLQITYSHKRNLLGVDRDLWHICVHVYVCVYIYICIEREREREGERPLCTIGMCIYPRGAIFSQRIQPNLRVGSGYSIVNQKMSLFPCNTWVYLQMGHPPLFKKKTMETTHPGEVRSKHPVGHGQGSQPYADGLT